MVREIIGEWNTPPRIVANVVAIILIMALVGILVGSGIVLLQIIQWYGTVVDNNTFCAIVGIEGSCDFLIDINWNILQISPYVLVFSVFIGMYLISKIHTDIKNSSMWRRRNVKS